MPLRKPRFQVVVADLFTEHGEFIIGERRRMDIPLYKEEYLVLRNGPLETALPLIEERGIIRVNVGRPL